MKDYIIAAAIFVLVILILPLVLANSGKRVNKSEPVYASLATTQGDVDFTVTEAPKGLKSTVEGFDFVCGVVAGEMPSDYDPEALKAQAVAAFSYCCYLSQHGRTIEPGEDVAYLPRSEAQKEWGKDFSARYGKIEGAVRDVYGKALFYGGVVVEANFFSISSGVTESSRDVFGEDLPYLVEVKSPGDQLAKGYETHVAISVPQFEKKVREAYSGALFGDPESFVTHIKRSGAGGVLTADLCGRTVPGTEIRELFSLRSTNFTVSAGGGKIDFDVKGYGHDVGMSQCGAQYMALEGKSWRQILAWYYPGTAVGDYLSNPFAGGATAALGPASPTN